ncbi:hypothetical protein VPH35_044178 [Triticum aestivum]
MRELRRPCFRLAVWLHHHLQPLPPAAPSTCDRPQPRLVHDVDNLLCSRCGHLLLETPPSASPWLSYISSVCQGCCPAAFSCHDQDPLLAPLVTAPPQHLSYARVRATPHWPPPCLCATPHRHGHRPFVAPLLP